MPRDAKSRRPEKPWVATRAAESETLGYQLRTEEGRAGDISSRPSSGSQPTRQIPDLPSTLATIGIVLVVCCAARAAGVATATITSTWRRTSSAASTGSRSIWPSADRCSRDQVLALDIAELAKSFAKGCKSRRSRSLQASQGQITNGNDLGLLRPRHHRPGCRRAAQKRDEFAPPHAEPSASYRRRCEGNGRADVRSGLEAGLLSLRNVSLPPIADIMADLVLRTLSARLDIAGLSFNHFVSAQEEQFGDFQIDHLGGLEIDNQLEFRRQFDR